MTLLTLFAMRDSSRKRRDKRLYQPTLTPCQWTIAGEKFGHIRALARYEYECGDAACCVSTGENWFLQVRTGLARARSRAVLGEQGPHRNLGRQRILDMYIQFP
jgi:hypothetical protein